MRDSRGQALFEFIIFLPILIALYVFLVATGSSINGSINQQKVARGYFFARIKHNSTIPMPDPEGNGQPSGAWSRFGMTFIGWRESWFEGSQVPLRSCYRLMLPLGRTEGDKCEDWENNTTQFIRPGTVFGICGATYDKVGSSFELSSQVSSVDSCLIQ